CDRAGDLRRARARGSRGRAARPRGLARSRRRRRCMKTLGLALGSALAILLVAGCGRARKQNEDLIQHVTLFQEGIGWRKYDIAAEYLASRVREAFVDTHDDLDTDLRIDDYELERIKVTDEHTRALVQVKYTWHLESKGIVHDTIIEENWERNGKI